LARLVQDVRHIAEAWSDGMKRCATGAAIVGLGLMGGSLAWHCANKTLSEIIRHANPHALMPGA
jgi:hypothetical protein